MTTSDSYPSLTLPAKQKERNPYLTSLLAGFVILILIAGGIARFTDGPFSGQVQTFVTIFMGIFVEAVPFLLLGSVVSGLIEVYVDRGAFDRFIPTRALPAAFTGALLGFAFPVCECGVVPVTRRLYQKGMPLSVGIAFLLAAPVVNPVVIISTYVAFGWGPVLIGRFIFSVLIAFAVGYLFSFAKPEEILLPETMDEHLNATCDHPHHHHNIHKEQKINVHDGDERLEASQSPITNPQSLPKRQTKLWSALSIGGDEFMDMARYLIIGSLLAAGMQTLVPQSTLLALGEGPVISVIALMVLAFVLSVCSTVDAFLALSFVNSFTTGSILSFLVFGPMVDIKSSLMFLGVFRRRTVMYLILLPLLFTLAISVFINLNLGW